MSTLFSPIPATARPLLSRLLVLVTIALLADAQNAAAGSVMDVLRQQPAFSRFVHLVQSSGLSDELERGGAITVFAPSNAAFDALPPETLQALSSQGDDNLIRETVRTLVVPEKWPPQNFAQKRLRLQAVNGQSILVDGTEGRLTANDAEILDADTTPSNGIIYEIDSIQPTQR